MTGLSENMSLFSVVEPEEDNYDKDDESGTVTDDKNGSPFGPGRRISENIFQEEMLILLNKLYKDYSKMLYNGITESQL